MNYVKINIDGLDADLPTDSLNLNLTYSIKGREGLAVNTGSRSEYSFELPSTKQNDIINNLFWDVGVVNPAVQVYRPAQIEVDGLPFFTGRAQMKSVTLRQDLYSWQGDKYRVAFYGDNIDWVSQAKDKRIVDYAFGSITYARANILADLANTYALADTYLFTLIKWKDWSVFGQVDLLEFTPALFVKTILESIFNGLGYTINSNFIGLDFFERLIMPIPIQERLGTEFSEDYINIEVVETFVLATTTLPPIIFTTQTVTPTLANPYNIGTGQYVCPYDGYYLVEGRGVISNVTGTIGCQIQHFYYQTGLGTYAIQQFIGDLSAIAYGGDTILTYSKVFYYNAGDIIAAGFFANTDTGAGRTFDLEYTWTVTGEAIVNDGDVIDFKYLINPDWKALDFIKGLAHAFNLTFQTDVNSQTVTIEPADDYAYRQRNPTATSIESGFYSTANAVDRTYQLDLSKGGELTSNSERPEAFTLAWKNDGADPTMEAINENADLKVLEGRYRFPTNRFKAGVEMVENPFFAGTLCLADSEIVASDSDKTPFVPIMWNENYLENSTSSEANYGIVPRLLISAPYITPGNGRINLFTGGGVSSALCPMAYMMNYNNTNNGYMSLSFGDETINGYAVAGLLNRFYLREMIRRQTGKEVETWLFWDVLQIANLDFSQLVQLNNDNYILQEVNNFNVLGNRSTKTFLVYNEEGDGTEQNNIENTELQSRVLI
jgi:hypothetical protein